jgi:hypothetical protein
MTNLQTKLGAICGWPLAVAAVTVGLAPMSAAAWVLLAAVAVLPPLVLLLLWNTPSETTSESIQRALRP